jgi:hypothetical protein
VVKRLRTGALVPRDLLIERLAALTRVGASLSPLEQAELRLCRYLAALSPDPEEFVRLLQEQRDSDFVPATSRTAAARLLRQWQARQRRPGRSVAAD